VHGLDKVHLAGVKFGKKLCKAWQPKRRLRWHAGAGRPSGMFTSPTWRISSFYGVFSCRKLSSNGLLQLASQLIIAIVGSESPRRLWISNSPCPVSTHRYWCQHQRLKFAAHTTDCIAISLHQSSS
jgi:hypothetical protein